MEFPVAIQNHFNFSVFDVRLGCFIFRVYLICCPYSVQKLTVTCVKSTQLLLNTPLRPQVRRKICAQGYVSTHVCISDTFRADCYRD